MVSFMNEIKIHVFHTGNVRVSPYLPFGGEHCNILKTSGIFIPKKKWLTLPVSCYLIEHPKGLILFDTGWNRNMSPNGMFDKKSQIKSLGSHVLYKTNQGWVEKGKCIDEQLANIGIKPIDLDYVILSHLDCDHANGLSLVKDAKHIIVSNDELKFANKKDFITKTRYQKKWWKDINLTGFDFNGNEGPFEKSYDLFGDGSIVLINIQGHSDGLCALKIINKETGKYVLLYSDGGYATKSWENMILPGIIDNKKKGIKSLEWIKQESLNPNCVESIANHDVDVIPHIIEI
jgi:N-acyl homoserine lactone hydrolase